MKETIRMRVPQVQSRGSASKIFLSRRAHVLRASLERSEWSFAAPGSAAEPAQSPMADEVVTRARLL